MRSPLNHVRLHPRLFIAAGVGILTGLLLPAGWGGLLRAIVAWDLATTLYLVLATVMMMRSTEETMRRRAAIQDESGWTLLAVSGAAAAASLCASIGLMSGFKDMPEAEQGLVLGLTALTIVSSWFFLHVLFALHYAHEFYGPDDDDDDTTTERGGLQFAGDCRRPTYVDFAYYSFTIGMTAQTSDTAVTRTKMRGLTLAHGVLTFFFNTVILALSINIAASLI